MRKSILYCFGVVRVSKALMIMMLCIVSLSSYAEDVYYGGVALQGYASDFDKTFPYINCLNQNFSGETPFLDNIFRDLFMENVGAFKQCSLKIGKADDEFCKKVLAFVLTGERVSVEEIGNLYKCCINLSAQLVVLDYESMCVVACYPLVWEIIEVFKEEPTREQILDLFMSEDIGLKSSFFRKPLLDTFPSVVIQDNSRSTLRIRNVTVEKEALPFLSPDYSRNLDAYKRWMASQYSAMLSSGLNIAIMPYSKDASNAKMALTFSNSEMLMFSIPPATYGVDVSLIRFKKVCAKETLAERLLVYGAYIKTKLYEPEYNHVYFEQEMKKGLPKRVPVTQVSVDDFAALRETLKNLFMESTEIMMSNKKAKKVLKKCMRK